MAELYLAKDTRVGRMVVIKRILPYLADEAEFLAMFLDEARIAAQLHHPNIVELFELGRLDGSTFIAMEWVEGVDLRKVLQQALARGAPVPPAFAAWLVARLCQGLAHAHERTADGKPLGIVHRDVGPQNVMVSYRGDVKLVDFGIAKATAWMSRSKPGVIKGKFLYLAPEQLSQEKLDHRADLFAVGTLLYELTVGKSPFFRGSTEAVINAIRLEDPPAPATVRPGYPEALSRIVMRCLEKDRNRRYQAASEVCAALEAFLAREARISQNDVAQYLVGLFGAEDERTGVFLPPNARARGDQAAAPPPKEKPPPPGADDEPTVSMVGATRPERAAVSAVRAVTRDLRVEPAPNPVVITAPLERQSRDVVTTAPFEVQEIAAAQGARPASVPDEVSKVDTEPTRSLEGRPGALRSPLPMQVNTADLVVPGSPPPADDAPVGPSPGRPTLDMAEVSRPPRGRPGPPVPDEHDEHDETKTDVPERAPMRPVRPNRGRRPSPEARRRPASALDPDDVAPTGDLSLTGDDPPFDGAPSRGSGRRLAVVALVALFAVALAVLAWWLTRSPPASALPAEPAATEGPEPSPAALVRVRFKAPRGVTVSVSGVEVSGGQYVEVPPGELRVRYVCPGRQRPRTHDVVQLVPAQGPYDMPLQCL
jgi:hypothetical protein